MVYRIEIAVEAELDLMTIFEFLVESYMALGDDEIEAFDRAHARMETIKGALRRLARLPKQGTLRPEIRPGLRSVTKDRAIIYFDVNDENGLLKVLAIFYGGQDHQRHMLERALKDKLV